MYLCSAVSQVSSYDTCQSVHFCSNSNQCMVLAEMKGCQPSGYKMDYEKLRYYNFTNFAQHFCQWKLNRLKL